MKWKSVIIIGIIVLAVLILSGIGSAAFYCPDGWQYQQEINISNTAGDQTDYQVKILTNLTDEYDAGKLNSTCKDLRFVNSTANLSYWIETCNTTGGDSTIWVEIPYLENNTNTSIYMCYGNPSASSVEDGDATFLLFDDFDDVTINDYFANNGINNAISGNLISPSGVQYNNKTFITWHGTSLDPYVRSYDHLTNSWSPQYWVGDNPLSGDAHGSPAIIRHPSGTLHIFYGSHGTAGCSGDACYTQHAKSDYVDNISAWTDKGNINGQHSTYPSPIIIGTEIYLFHRLWGGAGNWFKTSYTNSSDNGETWATSIDIIDFGTGYATYFGSFEEFNETIVHVAWVIHDYSDAKRKNVYHAYLNLTDLDMYSMNGTNLGSIINKAEADNNCIVLNSVISETNNPELHLDASGTPYVIFIHNDTGFNYEFAKWNGTGWDIVTITYAGHKFNSHDFIIHSPSNITAYLPVSAGVVRGGDIDEWEWNGSIWAKKANIMNETIQGRPLNFVSITLNHTDDLKIVFSEYIDDFSTPLEVFAWGENGFVESEIGVLNTSKWSPSVAGAFSVSNSWITGTGSVSSPRLESVDNISSVSFSMDHYLDVLALGGGSYGGYTSHFIGPVTDRITWYTEGDYDRRVCLNGSCSWKSGTNKGMTTGEVRLTTIKQDGKLRMITSGSRNFDDSWTGTTDNNDKAIRIFQSYTGYTVKADWILVRKYADPEPTTIFGAEESAPAGTDCNCSTCDECETKLNDADCSIVEMDASITDYAGTCIDNPVNFTNKTFDCQGHMIDGDDSNDIWGVYIYNSTNNTIKNCVITDFEAGVYFRGASQKNKINNNTVNSNTKTGIWIRNDGAKVPEWNNITNNTIQHNWDGIGLYSCSKGLLKNNTLYNNSDNGIWVLWTDNFDIDGNDITLNGQKVKADMTYSGGVGLQYSDSNNIINNNFDENRKGIILLMDSDSNVIRNNTIDTTNQTGLFLSNISNSNVINNNSICNSNQVGGYYDLRDNNSNSGDNNTCDTTSGWNDTGGFGCTYGCDCNAHSCESATYALNDSSCSQVVLTQDTETNRIGTCINSPDNFTNKVFDCQGYTIDGDDTGDDYGIHLDIKSVNTIKNCIVTDFGSGIFIYNSDFINITNCTTTSNNAYGVLLYTANNNRVVNSTISDNTQGVVLYGDSDDNVIENNIANSNTNNGLWVQSAGGTGNVINNNTFCNNNQAAGAYYDIYDADTNSGDNNTCDTTSNWNDTGTAGCTNPCSGITCGGTITSDTTLTENLTCTQNGVIIGASNIYLDCGGYHITGNGTYTGINITDYHNVTLKQCNGVSNFTYNIYGDNATNLNFSNFTFQGFDSNVWLTNTPTIYAQIRGEATYHGKYIFEGGKRTVLDASTNYYKIEVPPNRLTQLVIQRQGSIPDWVVVVAGAGIGGLGTVLAVWLYRRRRR